MNVHAVYRAVKRVGYTNTVHGGVVGDDAEH